jgi:hypothetical protein
MHGSPSQLSEGVELLERFMEANGRLMKRLANEDLFKHQTIVQTFLVRECYGGRDSHEF